MTMPTRALIALLSLVLTTGAFAEGYGDPATQEWFRSLSSMYALNCCDQADCHRTQSEYREGAWWALSVATGTWVQIRPDQITAYVSIFNDAVLCEGSPQQTVSGVAPNVYCFAPPPIGF